MVCGKEDVGGWHCNWPTRGRISVSLKLRRTKGHKFMAANRIVSRRRRVCSVVAMTFVGASPRNHKSLKRRLLLRMQLDAPVELEDVFLRQSVAVDGRERLVPSFRYEHQLARIPGLAQEAGNSLEPLP